MEKRKDKTAVRRLTAAMFWALALACEFAAVLAIVSKMDISGSLPQTVELILLLLADLILLIAGSRLWKTANQQAPVSREDGELRWWLFNNLGGLAAAACFLPFVLLPLSGKRADPRTKKTAGALAAAVLLIDVLIAFL